jgi:hypothetical protein
MLSYFEKLDEQVAEQIFGALVAWFSGTFVALRNF